MILCSSFYVKEAATEPLARVVLFNPLLMKSARLPGWAGANILICGQNAQTQIPPSAAVDPTLKDLK